MAQDGPSRICRVMTVPGVQGPHANVGQSASI
jgi:hypothetical protein